ncbi:hypothetical protein [Paenibacillus sp. NPDC058071]|uniref:hypothetical protein n=1 Tax=Paenibacillus sp. NPDC058071 TaxID=3346326 RepID=UPI0036DB7C1E
MNSVNQRCWTYIGREEDNCTYATLEPCAGEDCDGVAIAEQIVADYFERFPGETGPGWILVDTYWLDQNVKAMQAFQNKVNDLLARYPELQLNAFF